MYVRARGVLSYCDSPYELTVREVSGGTIAFLLPTSLPTGTVCGVELELDATGGVVRGALRVEAAGAQSDGGLAAHVGVLSPMSAGDAEAWREWIARRDQPDLDPPTEITLPRPGGSPPPPADAVPRHVVWDRRTGRVTVRWATREALRSDWASDLRLGGLLLDLPGPYPAYATPLTITLRGPEGLRFVVRGSIVGPARGGVAVTLELTGAEREELRQAAGGA